MPDPQTARYALVLAAHQPSSFVNSSAGTYECECSLEVPVPGGFTRDAYPIDWDAMRAAIIAHQAEHLAALPPADEPLWGVQDPEWVDGQVVPCRDEVSARELAAHRSWQVAVRVGDTWQVPA